MTLGLGLDKGIGMGLGVVSIGLGVVVMIGLGVVCCIFCANLDCSFLISCLILKEKQRKRNNFQTGSQSDGRRTKCFDEKATIVCVILRVSVHTFFGATLQFDTANQRNYVVTQWLKNPERCLIFGAKIQLGFQYFMRIVLFNFGHLANKKK